MNGVSLQTSRTPLPHEQPQLQPIADTLWRLVSRIEGLGHTANVLIGVVIVAVITVLDAAAGTDLLFGELCLVPIAVVTWLTRSARTGLLLAALAVVLRLSFGIDFDVVSAPLALAEAAMHSLLYCATVVLFGIVRRDRDLLEALTVTDPLTEVANLRAFRAAAQRELERSRRHRHSVSVLYFDIDDFKRVNDTYGHREGDSILKTVAAAARGVVRSTDLLARLGGDEFAVLMPETARPEAREVGMRLREALSDIKMPDGFGVTSSVGCVTYPDPPESVGQLLAGADRAMYEVKAAGKGAVCRDAPAHEVTLEAVS